ncbi:hypothetical protein SLA2020_040860 [Shorea laevis]
MVGQLDDLLLRRRCHKQPELPQQTMQLSGSYYSRLVSFGATTIALEPFVGVAFLTLHFVLPQAHCGVPTPQQSQTSSSLPSSFLRVISSYK